MHIGLRKGRKSSTRCTALLHPLSGKYPYYPGTQVATVMTVDFLVTQMVAGVKSLIERL